MLEIISCFFMVILTHLADFYLFSKLNKEEFKITKGIVIITLMDAVINTYINQNYPTGIRIIVTNFELVFMLKIIYNKTIIKTFLSSIIITIFYAITEMIVALTCINILNINSDILTNNVIGFILVNIVIIILTCICINVKPILKISQKILNWYKENKAINTIVLFIMVITTLTCLLYPISINNESITESFIFVIFFICTIIFVMGFFNEKSENNRLNEEYDHLLKYLQIYENELNDKMKSQHEFKNQLILIREMSKTKEVKEYITTLIGEEEKTKNELLLTSLKSIPSGGLKGLIYYKLSQIPKDTELHVNIGSDIKEKVWKKLNLNDISKIIGILLDNSIEAIKEENKKYLIIDIDQYKDEVIINISNSCTKNINFEKIDKEGYSIKGSNHGYGLSLVKDIINKNKNINIKREQNGIIFSTKIYINTK